MMNAPIAERPCRPRWARWPLVSVGVWIVLVVLLLAFMWTYESTPGSQGDPKALWPDEIALEPRGQGRTLLMFAHPRAPARGPVSMSYKGFSRIVPHSKKRGSFSFARKVPGRIGPIARWSKMRGR